MIIYYIIYFLLAVWIFKGIYNFLRAIIMRIILYIRLTKICKKRGYELIFPRFIFASFLRTSRKPDIIIMTPETDFFVRIMTCRARLRVYHFVNHEWFVRVAKTALLLPFLQGEVTLHRHVGHMPPLEAEGARARTVLLFNPAPLSVTFAAGNRRELASNGTDFEGWTTFNGKGFAEFLEGGG